MEHWHSKGKQKQPQGLVQILKQRKREETMISMLERVRTTQDAMERIHWEEKTETYPEHKRREQDQRSGSGVKGSMTGYEEPRDGPKFLRCSISEVINDIKSEQDMRLRNLDEKREMARRKKKEKDARELKEKEGLVKAKKPTYVVRTIDGLGVDEPPSHTPSSIEEEPVLKQKSSPQREDAPQQDIKTQTNIEHVISQACRALSKSTV